jgi:hypothetical protein
VACVASMHHGGMFGGCYIYKQVALKSNVLNKYEQVADNKDKIISFKYLRSSTCNHYCIVGFTSLGLT